MKRKKKKRKKRGKREKKTAQGRSLLRRTGLANLKVSLVVVLVLKDGLGHLEDDVAVQVALGLGEDEDGDGAGGVDEQPQHDEHPVGHVARGLLRPLSGLSQGGFVAILDAADDDANHQTCLETNNGIKSAMCIMYWRIVLSCMYGSVLRLDSVVPCSS